MLVISELHRVLCSCPQTQGLKLLGNTDQVSHHVRKGKRDRRYRPSGSLSGVARVMMCKSDRECGA